MANLNPIDTQAMGGHSVSKKIKTKNRSLIKGFEKIFANKNADKQKIIGNTEKIQKSKAKEFFLAKQKKLDVTNYEVTQPKNDDNLSPNNTRKVRNINILLSGQEATHVGNQALAMQGVQPKAEVFIKADKANDKIETIDIHREKDKKGFTVSVVDMRLRLGKEKSKTQNDTVPTSTDKNGIDGLSKSLDKGTGNSVMLSPEAQHESSPTQKSAESTQPNNFSQLLSAKLKDGAADIVRAAHIVLSDADTGFIRLRLEPQTLGGVKIELKMSDKQISGKIIVESDIAGEAFRSSLDSLKDAFNESGFDTTSLEVEIRNGMGSNAQNNGAEAKDDIQPYWSRAFRSIDNAVPDLASLEQPEFYGSKDRLINFLI